MDPVLGESSDSEVAGVKGVCAVGGGFGVWGVCDAYDFVLSYSLTLCGDFARAAPRLLKKALL
jgi:hypothetical protein